MKRHPYILVTIIATLLAIVVWLCVPKEYTAITKVSDEYKETELAIGFNSIKAHLKNAMGGANTGINDMAIYSKVLQTTDFARQIAHMQVPGKGITYGTYLGKEDTTEAIIDAINYNYSSRQETLTISFTDSDPVVASLMLDSVTVLLQQMITRHRHTIVDSALHNAQREVAVTKAKYRQAIDRYGQFVDSHVNISTNMLKQQEKALENESKTAYALYQKATEEYARQEALKQRSHLSFAVIQNNSVPLKDNSHLASYLLPFVFIALVLTKGYFLFKSHQKEKMRFDYGDFFSPWNLALCIWTADILLYLIQGTLDPIGPNFISCFILWIITFLPASIIAYWLCQDEKNHEVNFKEPIPANLWLFHSLFVISIIMTIAYAKTIWNVVSQFDIDNLLYNIRLLAVHETLTSGILNYTQSINYALFFVGIWLYPKISKYQLAAIVLLNLIIEFSMMEKSGILVMILGSLFVLYERKVIRITTIGVTLLSTILLFFFFNMAKEDTSSDAESMTFIDFFGMYVTSPLVAFDHLRITITDQWGPNTFNAVYPYINRLGFHFQTIERLQDFVAVPIITNVYTIMQPFYNDFGRPGVAFFGFAYGVVFGFVYRKFREGNILCRCLYTFLVEVIIIQFYNENFLQSFFLVAGFTFFLFLMTQDFVQLSFKTRNAQ